MPSSPLTQAMLSGMDPALVRNLPDLQTGQALVQQGMDTSPTGPWGALARVLQAGAGTYLQNSATSDLAKTYAQGRKAAQDQLMSSLMPQGGTAAVPQAVPQQAAPAADMSQPRGIRNNNPLNIESGDFTAAQPGVAGSDGRFAKFDTTENGMAAANKLLDVYEKKHGLNTVAGIVGRWAPAGDGNDVSAYASDVAGKLGIDPNTPIPKEMRPQLIAAMAQHENGKPVSVAQQVPAMVDAADLPPSSTPTAGQQSSAPPARTTPDLHKLMEVMQNPYADEATKSLAQKLIIQHLQPDDQPKWGIVGKDKYNQPVYGYPPTREEAAAQPKVTEKVDPLEGVQGPQRLEALKSADPARAAQAQAVLEGRVPFPTGSRLNMAQQQLKEDVLQTDPNFTTSTWTARNNFSKSMGGIAPNTYGGQLYSAGTVAKHLGDADKYLPVIEKGALGASDTLPVLNGAKGFVRDQMGDKAYQDATGHFRTVQQGLSDEAEKLLAGGPGAQASKAYWMDRLDISKHGPTEVRGALDEFRSLMHGRISNIAQEKDRVFGQAPGATDPLSLFGPKEQEIMKKVQSHSFGGGQEAESAAPAEQPPMPNARKAADGNWYTPDPGRPGKFLKVVP